MSEDMSRSRVLRDISKQEQFNAKSEDSDTLSMDEEGLSEDELMESCIRSEIQDWLSKHGKALFALECTKFLANERKRETAKNKR